MTGRPGRGVGRRALVLAVAGLITLRGSAATPRFFEDDPIAVVADSQDASAIKPWSLNLAAEIVTSLFMTPGDKAADVKALSVNTIDEVPDSSWFTNRVGSRRLTPDEMRRGPDTLQGPAPGPWTVVSSKNNGVTPGFTVRDATGQIWFLKFDAPGHRGMATGTEVVVTKLMWALGYFVPENYLAALAPDRLTIGDQATITTATGATRPMRRSDIAAMLDRVDRDPDGTYRVIASRALPKVGEFRFDGTHPDDPNDVIPHEHRRELRGYGIFAAWVNHVDAKGGNTLDALIRENGRAFVRHYLQDFGSALGSASVSPREHWEGAEAVVEPGRVWRQMLGFGFVIPEWRTAPFYEAPAIGRLVRDNRTFNPDQWRPRVPNAAFVRARDDDRFWAARKLAAVTDDLIRAAVDTGQFADAASEAFLARALAERRDAIVRSYLTRINPVADLALDRNGVLTFTNAAAEAGVARPAALHRAAWATFDNSSGAVRSFGGSTSETTRIQAPAGLPADAGAHIRVALSLDAPNPAWKVPVFGYFRRLASGDWKLVGLDRLPTGVPES